MARALVTVLVATLAWGCADAPEKTSVGIDQAKAACRAFDAAMNDLTSTTKSPKEAADAILAAQTIAQQAAKQNGRWRKLAGNLGFAAEGVAGLDPERAKTEANYLSNGPATTRIDAVRDECFNEADQRET
jgi:hypothetical protein